ncbi:uncharacterized protein UV8b_05913 [Ustilaginoidea virens]|uniref:DUF1264 domain protein n=1 Tax=Ustilaginoidea virens TaxID=1159556 RepID=A0A8E5HU47_USTVR|nr:uncharacterized protein UV8b_05913 [Ustilaginoidea virens]QUC21670.1 hypothetical protein UV8b_05913 [Ustilaginoidea virens]
MESTPMVHDAYGAPRSRTNAALATAASLTQDFEPIKNICAHLNAFHAYADDVHRSVETNHYCSHLSDDVRQCLLYDSPDRNARLIGIEYMIKPHLYEALPPEERKLWHSHVYEVKSGMLVMPNPMVPQRAWEKAETKEMEEIITLYGKVFHLWQTDRGDKLPIGQPKLMTSFTADGQLDFAKVEERDARFGTDYRRKRELRSDIACPEIHPDADPGQPKGSTATTAAAP